MRMILKIKFALAAVFIIFLVEQTEARNSNRYLINAITKAVNLYIQQKKVDYCEYMVIRVKLMAADRNCGEFVLSDVISESSYSDLNPTHYIRVNEKIVLIKVDSTCNCNPESYGINRISEFEKREALKVLLGHEEGICVTRQSPPLMVFNYKKNKLRSQFYYPTCRAPEKYWF